MLLLSLSTTLSLSCSTFHTTKELSVHPVDPEIHPSPGLQHGVSIRTVQTELNVPFDKGWAVILDTLKQSGHFILVADREKGELRTQARLFEGPEYPLRESYSVWIASARNGHTMLKVRRTVSVYRRIFLVGPAVWMARSSNGQREKNLIEQIEQRLVNGAAGDEK
jgi:hypothetical protein